MEEEIWKDVVGFEGAYMVSNFGRVMSLNYHNFHIKKILNLRKNRKGYLIIALCYNGKKLLTFAHRLVAMAFIPNPQNLPQVNHKDENKENNCVNNLEWCDCLYNNNYGSRNIKIRETFKSFKSHKVFQYDLECNLLAIYDSAEDAGRKTGISPSAIRACCRGKHKTHAGFYWREEGCIPKIGDNIRIYKRRLSDEQVRIIRELHLTRKGVMEMFGIVLSKGYVKGIRDGKYYKDIQ